MSPFSLDISICICPSFPFYPIKSYSLTTLIYWSFLESLWLVMCFCSISGLNHKCNIHCMICCLPPISLHAYSGQRFPLSHLPPSAAAAKSRQSCPTLCDPIDSHSWGSPIPGILQARTLEWVAISFSNAWKWKVKVKSLSHVWLLATPWAAAFQAPPSMGFSRQEYWSGVPLPSPCLTVAGIIWIKHTFYFHQNHVRFKMQKGRSSFAIL